ncbi:MAG: photosynthetic complex putative assembly protein PuhB [Rubrimonas sp.]|uniref:photosynthetic complex putative assembly protein PuhB n=1 Tax=Rubrimonas sp. TaxID=2036015 RepID=UPI002FDDC817
MSEFETDSALPGILPPGERVLWKGKPDWRRLARSAYLGGLVAIYFGVLIVWRLVEALADGAAPAVALSYAGALVPMALLSLAIIGFLGWMGARVTVYTITNKRVVMKIGAALTMSVNVPFKRVAGAALRRTGREHGDIVLKVAGKERFSWFLLWPHVRPWSQIRPEPMLRALRDAPEAARILGAALEAYQAEFGMELDPDAGEAPEKRRRREQAQARRMRADAGRNASMTPAE